MILVKPKISIVVPIYNVEEYLPCCIESVLAQTYAHFELLLIDDGSPDRSGKICDAYAAKDPRIRVFHKENGGVSSARNLGLDNAKGDIITFLDADDWIGPTYCDTIITNMMNTDILFFSETWHYEDGCMAFYSAGDREAVGKENVEEEIFRLLPFNNTMKHYFYTYTWNKAFLRHIIEENHIRFVDSLFFGEDHVFTFEYCLQIERLKYIEANIYHYRCRDSGLTYKFKPVEQFMLYYNSVNQLVGGFSNPRLVRSINDLLSSALVRAFFASPNLRSKRKVFSMLRSHCKNTKVENPLKEEITRRVTRKILSFNKQS